MTTIKYSWVLWSMLTLILLFCIWAIGIWWYAKSIETPRYTVLEKYPEFEIRKYDPVIVAQVEQSGDTQESINSGFGILADYIFGNNISSDTINMTAPVIDSKNGESIAMTAPVIESQKTSEAIAMTTPVIDITNKNSRTITFTMPSKWTMKTLPKPNNPNIKIVEWESEKKAVSSFILVSFFNISTREKAAQKLLKNLEKKGIEHKNDVHFAFYNPPLTPFFIRRNEVMVTIEE